MIFFRKQFIEVSWIIVFQEISAVSFLIQDIDPLFKSFLLLNDASIVNGLL